MNVKAIVLEFICALFATLFTYASLSKLIDIQKFTVQIGKSPLLTDIAPYIAWGIPTIELIVAISLWIPKFRLAALYVSFGLMIAFTAYIVAILKFSEYIPCSCGGVLQDMSWTQHLIFNCGFILLALAGIFIAPRTSNIHNGSSEKPLAIN